MSVRHDTGWPLRSRGASGTFQIKTGRSLNREKTVYTPSRVERFLTPQECLIFGNTGLLVEELVVFLQLVNLHVNVTVGRVF